MLYFSLAFLLGNVCVQLLPQLLPIYVLMFAFMVSLLMKRLIVVVFVLGMCFASWYAYTSLAWTLPADREGEPILVTGYIASLPRHDQFGQHFDFQLTKTHHPRVHLTWSGRHPLVKAGDQWQLLVKLKRIHGMRSPGAFNVEALALEEGIRASGSVISSRDNQLLSHHWYHYPIHQFREYMQTKINKTLNGEHFSPWLMALIIGERAGVPQADWHVLRDTGTNHLMAIAGLHIGFLAAMMYWLMSWCWRRSEYLMLYLPAQQAGAILALIAAIIYSTLAGFSIPTQRACVMIVIGMMMLFLKRKINLWHSLGFAMFIVQLLNPLSILTESFWLSFCTIALMIYGMGGRLETNTIWWKWGRAQWVIGLGLIPLTLYCFQACSLVSFIANIIAIPWLAFLILPFCFFGSLFIFIMPKIGVMMLWLANKSLMGLWFFLSEMASFHYASLYLNIPTIYLLIVTMAGILLLLLPIGFPGRLLGLIWLLPVMLYKPLQPNYGDIWLTVLDVGQGLSVIVRTEKHVLVYDTGEKFGENCDMGESIVVPFLHSISANHVDELVISHGDNDHIGGAPALIHAFNILKTQSSIPEKIKVENKSHCVAGESWNWDGVQFVFLSPPKEWSYNRNNSSCVLAIYNQYHRVLLTGDIEKLAEENLLATVKEKLSADILIAPHHGSKTSAIPAFLEAVHPKIVVYATGYRNRYHFPHPSVVAAYQAIHAIQFNTMETGTLEFKLKNDDNPDIQIEQYRASHPQYFDWI